MAEVRLGRAGAAAIRHKDFSTTEKKKTFSLGIVMGQLMAFQIIPIGKHSCHCSLLFYSNEGKRFIFLLPIHSPERAGAERAEGKGGHLLGSSENLGVGILALSGKKTGV